MLDARHSFGSIRTAHLVVDGKTFYSTWRAKKDAEGMVQRAAKHNHKLVMRDYGVDIHRINPENNEVVTWDKSKGYSVWE
jgi:hypothetical protein